MIDNPCLLTTTFPDQEIADQIVTLLSTTKLVACMQLTPVHSVFMWEGEQKKIQEIRCDMKTMQRHILAIKALLDKYHPYQLYEFVVLPIQNTQSEYSQWINQSVNPL